MMDSKVSQVKSLLRTLALYVEARGRLLQIEAREAGSHFSVILILAALLAGCLLCGWLLALPALVWLVADSQGWRWWYVALGAAATHLFLAFILLATLKVRLKKLRVFEETFHQFQRDRECLSQPPHGS